MKKSLIILGSIVVIVGLVWFGLVYWIGSGIGGGGSEQYAPDTVQTGEPADVTLIVTATGGGGKIQGRFTNLSLHYRLVGENTYKSIQPQQIDLPDNFKTVQSKTFQSEAYKFTIPLYPKGTTGEIEYYTEMTFDGYQSRQDGVKKIKIIPSPSPSPSPSSTTATTNSSVTFQGHISKDQSFQKDIGKGLIFKLTPDSNGWDMDVVSNTAEQYDYGFASIATPPFHGITALQIEGWHFRNINNTAQNDGGVNAPQMTRDFSFVLNKQDAKTMADAIGLFTSGKTLDFNPDVSSFGKGELVIQNLKLGNLVAGSQAWIESMDFNVTITFPKANQQNSYLLNSSSTAITIKSNGVVIKTITLKDISSFDTNDVGTPSNPEKDYAFDYNPFLDNTYGVVYFSVSNRTTAGNANADRALFSYNVTNKKLTLLKKEEFSVSFASLYTSNDGNYLVYGDGNHGGLCYNTLGLGVYDLKNNKDLGTFFLPTTTTGMIEFDHWVNNSSFVYKEETFLNVDECRNNYNENPHITYKTYQIK